MVLPKIIFKFASFLNLSSAVLRLKEFRRRKAEFQRKALKSFFFFPVKISCISSALGATGERKVPFATVLIGKVNLWAGLILMQLPSHISRLQVLWPINHPLAHSQGEFLSNAFFFKCDDGDSNNNLNVFLAIRRIFI